MQRRLVNFSFNVDSTQLLTRNDYSFTRETSCSRTIESHQLNYIDAQRCLSLSINWQARCFYIWRVFSLKFFPGETDPFQGKTAFRFQKRRVDFQSKATSRINYSARSNYSCYMLPARRTNRVSDRHVR